MLSAVLSEHLARPRNVGRPDGECRSVRVTNPVCGDVVDLYLVEDHCGCQLRFEARACSAVVAFFSFVTEKLSGAASPELQAVDVNGLVHDVGGLPAGKGHAADLLRRALSAIRPSNRTR